MEFRAFAKKPVFVGAAGALVATLIRLVKRTSSAVYEPPNFHAKVGANQPFILAMWHGQFMMLADLNTPDFKVSAIVSRHGDGDLTAATLEHFGVRPIRGAGAGGRKKDRGGAHALRIALRALKSGSTVAMTADVPTALPRVAGEGIVTLARLSGRPIIPVAAATSRYFTLNTWSQMTVNLPFSTLVFVAGDPLFVPPQSNKKELERARQKIEHALDEVTGRAYALAAVGGRRGASEISSTTTRHVAE
jgi:lysophospholipid acyltransferase (LPLAT)-like uncharacterized protein